MKAMILAAGRGTRVRPFTDRLPKPLLPVLGTPVIETLVELLRDHGVEEIVINTSYRSEQIESVLGDGRRFGARIAYSFEGYLEEGELHGEPLGSAGAIRRIQEHSGFFDTPFFVLCGDALIDVDLTAMRNRHDARAALASLALVEVPREDVTNYGVAVTGAAGRIEGFQEKPTIEAARSTAANTGIYLFDPAVIEHIPAGVVYDIGSQLLPALVDAGAPVYGDACVEEWLDIGRLSDYYRATQLALSGQAPRVERPGQQVRDDLWLGANVSIDLERTTIVGPVCIAGSAVVEPGATLIGPVWIGAGSIIETGATVTRSVVLDHTRVGGTADVSDMVVCGEHCVTADGTTVSLAGRGIEWAVSDARVPSSVTRQSRRQFVDSFIRAEPITATAY